jgi:hypothetical protein
VSRWLAVLVVPVAAGALVVGLASLALAEGKKQPEIKDAKGDSKAGHADIRSVSFTQTAKTDVWRITTYEAFNTHDAPCVVIASAHPSGARWSACGKGEGVAPPCSMGVSLSGPYRLGGGCAGDDHSNRPSRTSIVYHVPRKTFALKPVPKRITWRVQVTEFPDCAAPNDACDSAPNSGSIAARP